MLLESQKASTKLSCKSPIRMEVTNIFLFFQESQTLSSNEKFLPCSLPILSQTPISLKRLPTYLSYLTSPQNPLYFGILWNLFSLLFFEKSAKFLNFKKKNCQKGSSLSLILESFCSQKPKKFSRILKKIENFHTQFSVVNCFCPLQFIVFESENPILSEKTPNTCSSSTFCLISISISQPEHVFSVTNSLLTQLEMKQILL